MLPSSMESGVGVQNHSGRKVWPDFTCNPKKIWERTNVYFVFNHFFFIRQYGDVSSKEEGEGKARLKLIVCTEKRHHLFTIFWCVVTQTLNSFIIFVDTHICRRCISSPSDYTNKLADRAVLFCSTKLVLMFRGFLNSSKMLERAIIDFGFH